MFYTLYNTDYVQNVYFGCTNAEQTAIEYVGEMPAGYTSFEDWAENENINAWRVVNGDLAYDAAKDEELQEQYIADHEDNRHVSNKELQDTLAGSYLTDEEISFVVSNSKVLAEMLPIKTVSGSTIRFSNASANPVQSIELTTLNNITGNIKIVFNNKNIFKNTAVNKVDNGITYQVNTDKTIKINGTATANSECAIAGNATNIVPIFQLFATVNYYLENLPTGVTVNLYSYDGTDLTLVYSGAGGTVLNFNEQQNITYATISVANGTTITNAVASLMLSVGNTSANYMTYKEQSILIPLGANTFETTDKITIDSYGTVNLVKTNSTIQLETVTMPYTYTDYNTVYTTKHNIMRLVYQKANFDYEIATANMILALRDVPDGVGSVHKLTFTGLTAGVTHTIHGFYDNDRYKDYTLDLTNFSGTVDVSIVDGEVQVFQSGSQIGMLTDPIIIETYSPLTQIWVDDYISCPMTCEYMTKSLNDVFCTRTEKNASIQIIEDCISLIVSQGGDVTPASIIAAINDNTSSVKISADNIDIAGVNFPTIRNTANTCSIQTNTTYQGDDTIAYNAERHQFSGGGIYIEDGNDISTNGTMWADNARLGVNSNDATLLDAGFVNQDEVAVNGDLDVKGALNLGYNNYNKPVIAYNPTTDVLIVGRFGSNKFIEIDGNANMTIHGDVEIKGDLTVTGTIHN